MVFKKESHSNIEPLERRKHWRDRRTSGDRRNPARLSLTDYDCREETRRSSDFSGQLTDGEIWWNNNAVKYE